MATLTKQEAPPAGPLDSPESVLTPQPHLVGIGAYTDIEAIYGPTEAQAGETVNIQVKVKNLHTTGIYIGCTGRYNGSDFALEPAYAVVGAGQSYTFSYSFSMLDHDTRVDIWCFYWSDPNWIEDDHEYVVIDLESGPGGWQLLDQVTVNVQVAEAPPAGWQLLDQVTVDVQAAEAPPAGWQLLDQVTVNVQAAEAPPAGWQLLDQVALAVKAGPMTGDWQLVEHYIDPWAYYWDDEVEVAVAQYTLPPEEFPWTDDLAMKITEKLKSDLIEQGSHLLEWEVYMNEAGPLWSEWRIKVTGTVPAGVSTKRTIGYVIPWPLIIKGALIIAGLIIVYFIVKQITQGSYTQKQLSEPIKAQWSNETLMGIILDLRPNQYTREELEQKDHQELMDIADEIYEEEAPPEGGGWPWYKWLAVTGIAVGGSVAAVYGIRAYIATRPEKKKVK